MFSKNGLDNISVPRALEGLATSSSGGGVWGPPLNLQDCGGGFDQQMIPEWCCVIPEALRKPSTRSCSTPSRMHSGAWISMEEVPPLWGRPSGETRESERNAQGGPGIPTSKALSLPARHLPRKGVKLLLIPASALMAKMSLHFTALSENCLVAFSQLLELWDTTIKWLLLF